VLGEEAFTFPGELGQVKGRDCPSQSHRMPGCAPISGSNREREREWGRGKADMGLSGTIGQETRDRSNLSRGAAAASVARDHRN
jgi:hypothetical protein